MSSVLIYNIGFVTDDGMFDETQLDIEESSTEDFFCILVNLILSLREEMHIKEVKYITFVGVREEDCEDA